MGWRSQHRQDRAKTEIGPGTSCQFSVLFLVLIAMSYMTGAVRAQTENWRLANRFQVGWQWDDNIYESSRLQQGASVAHLLLQFQLDRPSANPRCWLDYTGTLFLFLGHSDESKSYHDAKGGISIATSPWLRLHFDGELTFKAFLDNTTDYGTSLLRAGATAWLSERSAFEGGFEAGWLDFAAFDFFDFRFAGAVLGYRRRLGRRTTFFLQFNQRLIDYNQTFFSNFQTTYRQDTPTTLRLTTTHSGRWAINGLLEAQFNRSNLPGYEFFRLRAQLLAAVRPWGNWTVRSSIMLQHKSYRIPTVHTFPLELDPEREQSNQLVLDVMRSLSSTTSLLARLAHYNNESPIRTVYYRKTIVFAGIEIRR